MISRTAALDLATWKVTCKALLAAEIPPDQIVWLDEAQGALFPAEAVPIPAAPPEGALRVPARLLAITEWVLRHRLIERCDVLYRLTFRITRGERGLLSSLTDPDVERATELERAVRKDAHRMQAFVRFKETEVAPGVSRFMSWYAPDHEILTLVAPIFASRFRDRSWSVLTPTRSAHYDAGQLRYGPGATPPQQEADDPLEELFRTYYAAVFDPARLNPVAMRRDLPGRRLRALPEARIVPELIRGAERRKSSMIARADVLPRTEHFLPQVRDLGKLANAAATCRGCSLYQAATQTVFGEGRANARLMFVGEQPGDTEDQLGRVFTGPAGKLLDRVFAEAGIEREQAYLTNAVKHFRFEQRGKARIHQRPKPGDVRACRPWLEAEIAAVRPHVIVCLGATAAQSLLGATFRLTQSRGSELKTPWAQITIPTWHPANILRAPDDSTRAQLFLELVRDCARAKSLAHAPEALQPR